MAVFVLARTFVAGLFGLFIAFLGQRLIGLQTGIWLIFAALYLAIGASLLLGRAGLIKKRIDLAPAAWKQARNPLVLGLAFGLNIPACAAPILFGLLALAATGTTIFTGFAMMALFGLALSAPLVLAAWNQKLAQGLERVAQWLGRTGWIVGALFVLLGLWSLWFGLFVEPVDWSGR